jgi:hypothetical protein
MGQLPAARLHGRRGKDSGDIMTGKTFLNRVAQGQTDVVALLLSLLG